MPLYLTLSRGPRADQATPILASSEPAVIAAVLQAVGRLAEPSGPDSDANADDPRHAGWRVLVPTEGADDDDGS